MTLRRLSGQEVGFTRSPTVLVCFLVGITSTEVALYAGSQQLSERDAAPLPAQSTAEKMEWKWSDLRASPEWCAAAAGRGYKVVTPDPPASHAVYLSQHGKAVYSWTGHKHSVFVVDHGVLYYSDFNPYRNGCAVIAYDTASGKRLWRTSLRGIGPQAHSRYSNRVNLDFDGKYLVVYGNESFGRYIELLDPKTGQTVGHRLVPKDEDVPATHPKPNQDGTGSP